MGRKLSETEEMKPVWFNQNQIPYESMGLMIFWLLLVLLYKDSRQIYFWRNDIVLNK